MATTRRGRGEGSIYQRHDHPTCPPLIDGERADHRCRGRWVATIDRSTSIGQPRDRRTLYGKTKAEVQTKLRTALAAAPTGRPSTMPTVSEWMDTWLAEYKPKLKPQTRRSHSSKIDTYVKPLIGKTRLDRLTTLQVEQIEARITRACPDPSPTGKCPHKPHHGLSVSTARQTFVILRDALGDAVKAKIIAENPAKLADAPSTYQAQRPHMTTPVVNHVLVVAAGRGEEARWRLALEMGLRQGEVLGLLWGLVDLDEGTLTIARTVEQDGAVGTPKSDASRRTLAMWPGTWGALRAMHSHLVAAGTPPAPADPIFTRTPDADRAAWRRLLTAAAVPYVALHSARQSAARNLEERGWPERLAAEFLGQSNVNTTYRYQRGAGVEGMRRAIGA